MKNGRRPLYAPIIINTVNLIHIYDETRQVSYFLFQPVLHDWCNKGCGMCYPVCGMMHIKEPLAAIRKE